MMTQEHRSCVRAAPRMPDMHGLLEGGTQLNVASVYSAWYQHVFLHCIPAKTPSRK
jgi:hypothetical protein